MCNVFGSKSGIELVLTQQIIFLNFAKVDGDLEELSKETKEDMQTAILKNISKKYINQFSLYTDIVFRPFSK